MPTLPDTRPPPFRAVRAGVVLLVAAWVGALALPNLLSIPVWPWTPKLWTTTGGEDATALGLQAAVAALVTGLAVSAMLMALFGRFGRFALATLPLMLLVPVEAWYVLEYGQPSNAHVLGVLVESNPAEAAEFAGGRVAMLLGAYAAFAVAACMAAWGLHRSSGAWTTRARVWTFAFAAGTLAVAGAPAWLQPPMAAATAAVHEPMSASGDAWRRFVDDTAAVFPWGVPVRIADYVVERRSILARAEHARGVHLGARLDPSLAPIDVVLVIGESARADRFGTGPGAPRTSPRIAALDGVTMFDDVVTPAAATRLAVPRIVAGGLARGAGDTEGLPSIVAALHEAGFRTWWISNHNTVGEHDDTIAPYAEEADVRRFENAGASNRKSAFDGALVGQLERALATPADRRFVVLHMLGSHFNYRFRYPDEYDRFRPSLGRDDATSIYDADRRDAIRNAYDNSILYTDHVLAELVETLGRTGRPSVLVFVSDHGQVLFEGMCGKAGHGIPSSLAYRVPLLVWMSPGMRERRPGAAAELDSHRSMPITVDAVAPTLADLAGVAIPGVPAEKSLASAHFVPGARRVTPDGRHWIDFDRDVPAIDCATALARAKAAH